MIRIAIVEDEAAEAERLQEYIRRYSKEALVAAETDVFLNPNAFLQKYRADHDLIFLDIEMPELDGISVARRIRALDAEVPIVFVTNMKKLALKGYEVDALDFIVKPLGYYGFALAFKKARQVIARLAKHQITVPIKFGERRLNVADIRYVETFARKLVFHLAEEEVVSPGALRDVEERLRSYNFARCNSCYLVNLRYVTKIYKDDVYLGDICLAVSRSKKKSFTDELTNYWGQS